MGDELKKTRYTLSDDDEPPGLRDAEKINERIRQDYEERQERQATIIVKEIDKQVQIVVEKKVDIQVAAAKQRIQAQKEIKKQERQESISTFLNPLILALLLVPAGYAIWFTTLRVLRLIYPQPDSITQQIALPIAIVLTVLVTFILGIFGKVFPPIRLSRRIPIAFIVFLIIYFGITPILPGLLLSMQFPFIWSLIAVLLCFYNFGKPQPELQIENELENKINPEVFRKNIKDEMTISIDDTLKAQFPPSNPDEVQGREMRSQEDVQKIATLRDKNLTKRVKRKLQDYYKNYMYERDE